MQDKIQAKVLLYFIISLCHIPAFYAQTDQIVTPKSFVFELGLGNVIPITDNEMFFDGYFSIGYQRQLNTKFWGLFISGNYRQEFTNDYSITPKARFGYLISPTKNMSLDLGYSLYSLKKLNFPGTSIGLNIDQTNKYGFHIRYELFKDDKNTTQKGIALGLHLYNSETYKAGLPIIGGITLVTAYIIAKGLAGSR